ncbi:DnaD domain-containing protein [Listeria booriae]|uniref:DnaD domain-containing protein n=1 Tax=Listeria booriae TaxID=1552123 RepID=UPI00162825B3|nr:DnaD domain protein [Listeria booriae]MBC2392240.1 DnaD domain protein [Listeria booriae]
MNYITELNAFYDRLEINQLTPSAIALWHALMHINNKAAWSTTFTVAASVLQQKSGLKESMFKKARNELKQAGYIDFQSRKGNQAPVYQMKSLLVHYDRKEVVPSQYDLNSVGNGDYNSVHNGVRSSDPLIKEKENEKEIKPTVSPYQYYQKKFGRDMSSIALQKLLHWIELDKMPEDLINYAMDITAEEANNPNKRKMNPENYIDGILKNWSRVGIKTLEEAKSEKNPTSTGNKSDFDSLLEKLKKEAAADGVNAGISANRNSF